MVVVRPVVGLQEAVPAVWGDPGPSGATVPMGHSGTVPREIPSWIAQSWTAIAAAARIRLTLSKTDEGPGESRFDSRDPRRRRSLTRYEPMERWESIVLAEPRGNESPFELQYNFRPFARSRRIRSMMNGTGAPMVERQLFRVLLQGVRWL